MNEIVFNRKDARESIIICDVCNGTGHWKRDELTDYHRNDYRYWNEFCSKCKGEGRVILVKFEQTIKFKGAGVTNTYTGTTIEHEFEEPLNGRKTEDIYKIEIPKKTV